jgi:uncharacterized membrane protein
MRLLLCLASLCAVASAGAAPLFTVAPLGLIPNSINSRGDVAGITFGGHAAVSFQGVVTDLGTLGGVRSEALQINDVGQVAGSSRTLSGDVALFLYTGGVMQQILGPDKFGAGYSDETALQHLSLNNSGQVTACFVFQLDGEWSYSSFLYQATGVSRTSPIAINNRGDILAFPNKNSGQVEIIRNGKVESPLAPLNRAGEISGAMINNHGAIAGGIRYHYPQQKNETAFLYAKGRLTLIKPPGGKNSVAIALNESNQMLISAPNKQSPLYLYTGGRLRILQNLVITAGWSHFTAADINNQGQIVGTAVNAMGNPEGVILTPGPDVIIAAGKSVMTTASHIVIRGRSTGYPTSVRYRVGGGRERVAHGRDVWHFTAQLKPGQNRIAIRAMGKELNSLPETIVVTRR